MNKTSANPTSYRAWKQKETPKEVKMDSFKDFPDLVADPKKKTVFEGVSLASKLKEVLAAEEEAAIQKRLKKGDTPEQILREGCVVLPLKSSSKKRSTEELSVPDWVLDHTAPVAFPSFRPKSLQQAQQERYWARLGINPTQTYLYDDDVEDDAAEDDAASVISLPNPKEEFEVLSEEE
jgi:hypothetical protein